jgi:hypothetical protein
VDLGVSEGSTGLITLQQLQALQARGSAGLVPGYVLGLAAVPAMLPAHLAGIQQQQQQENSRGQAAALDRQLSGSLGGYAGGAGSEQHSAGALSGREGSGGHLLTDDGLPCGAATSTASPAHSSQTPPYVDCGDDTEGTGGGSEGGGGAHKVVLPAVNLRVMCGDLVGVLMVDKAKVVMHRGTPQQKEVSPTEFERLGGRSATKKWKQSIRLIADNGACVLGEGCACGLQALGHEWPPCSAYGSAGVHGALCVCSSPCSLLLCPHSNHRWFRCHHQASRGARWASGTCRWAWSRPSGLGRRRASMPAALPPSTWTATTATTGTWWQQPQQQ